MNKPIAKQGHEPFRVAFTGDFQDSAGKPKYHDFGLGVLNAQRHIEHRIIHETSPELTPEQIADAHGVIVLYPRVTQREFGQNWPDLAGGLHVSESDTTASTSKPAPTRMCWS